MGTAHLRGSSLTLAYGRRCMPASSPPSAYARKEPPRSCLNLPTWSQHHQPHAYTDSTSTREHKPPRHFIRLALTTRCGQHVSASGYAATGLRPLVSKGRRRGTRLREDYVSTPVDTMPAPIGGGAAQRPAMPVTRVDQRDTPRVWNSCRKNQLYGNIISFCKATAICTDIVHKSYLSQCS